MARDRFSRRAIERIAENRIRQAVEEGLFDSLRGEGRPIPGIDLPYDPLWWFRQWIRRERLAVVFTGAAWSEARAESSTPDRLSRRSSA